MLIDIHCSLMLIDADADDTADAVSDADADDGTMGFWADKLMSI